VHINCAHKSGWRMGFDIQPVKGSRRDTFNIVKLGNETGVMTACLWCPEHEIKSTVHGMNEIAEDGSTALELFINTYKQADLSVTGTVRKATNLPLNGKATNRRNSLVGKEGPDSSTTVFIKSEGEDRVAAGLEGLLHDHVGGDGPKRCIQCNVDVSPLWWKVPLPSPTTNGAGSSAAPLTNGHTAKTTSGLMCSRCHHASDKDQPPSAKTNGTRNPDPKFLPLSPLHVFLAQQHQHQAMRQQQQQAQAAMPAHPPPPPAGLPPRAVSLPQQGGIPPPLPSPQRPPMGPIPHPPMPHGMARQVSQPPPVHTAPHHPHPPPYQPHHPPQPPPPPPPHHMSPRPPLPPAMHHGSPSAHVHRQLHPPVVQNHLISPQHRPPPPPHMMPVQHHTPQMLHRQNSHPMPHQPPPQVLHAPIPPPPQPAMVQQQAEQRRVMSGASGSPAVANLLS
jgi:hypothetical protein